MTELETITSSTNITKMYHEIWSLVTKVNYYVYNTR